MQNIAKAWAKMRKNLKMQYFIFFIVLFLICMVTYFSSLSYDFVFDDNALVVENPIIKDFNYVGKIFTSGLFDVSYDNSKPNYYRPLQLISVMLDYRIWKLNPFGYHLTNVLLHFLNAFLIFGLICLLFEDFFIAVFSSTLFCIHPINTSAVTYISGRADLLVSLFILAAFFCAASALKYNKSTKIKFALVILFFILALLSRENAAIAPLGMFSLPFFTKGQRKHGVYLFAATFFVLIIYLYIRVGALNIPFTGHSVMHIPFYFRPINFLYVIFSYLFLLVVPVNLYLMHVTNPILGVSDIRLWIVAVLFLTFIVCGYLKRKNKITIFSAMWFFIFILPVFFVMDNFAAKLTMAENWLYLASVGFYIMAGETLISFKRYLKIFFYPLIAGIFLIYFALTVINSANFKDRAILSKHILQFDSTNKEARKELAGIYLDKKQYDLAIEQIDKALKTSFFDEDLYLLQGLYYEDTGNIDRAVSSYDKILEITPRSSRANNNLGGIYLNNGNLDKAEVFLRRAVRINPLLYEPYLNLAKLNYKREEINAAVSFYEKALSLNPHLNEAILALAQIYKGQGDVKRAINILKRAAGPDEPILVMQGMLTAEQGLNEQAEYYFKQALRVNPKSDYVMFNLGVFYANNNQLDKAVKVWQEALNNNPDNKEIKDYMEKARELLTVQK